MSDEMVLLIERVEIVMPALPFIVDNTCRVYLAEQACSIFSLVRRPYLHLANCLIISSAST